MQMVSGLIRGRRPLAAVALGVVTVLGAAPASAGVTWLDALPGGGPSSIVALDAGVVGQTWSGAAALQAQSINDGSPTASISAVTSTGFTGNY